jgi:hypothetical protein
MSNQYQDTITEILNDIIINKKFTITEKLQKWLLNVLSSEKFIISEEGDNCYNSSKYITSPHIYDDIIGNYVHVNEIINLINNIDKRIVCYPTSRGRQRKTPSGSYEEYTDFLIFFSKNPYNECLKDLRRYIYG